MHTFIRGLRAVLLVAAAFGMLTRTEAQGLAIHRVNPQLRAVIGMIADSRPVIVGRCTYADYVLANGDFGPSGTPVASFTFPGSTITPGFQLHAVIGGLYRNGTGAAKQVGARLRLTGANGVTQTLGFTAGVASLGGGLASAWRSDIILAASIPGAVGQYVPTIQQNATTKGKTYTSGLSPNNAIAFTEVSETIVTDTNYASGQDSGGIILNATPFGSGASSNLFQQVYDATQNITVELILPQSGLAPTEMTVAMGYMEAF
jgi:hypothetical protein